MSLPGSPCPRVVAHGSHRWIDGRRRAMFCPGLEETAPGTFALVLPSPDCRDGKHTACTGSGWDETNDRAVSCPCSCHVVPPVDPHVEEILEVAGADGATFRYAGSPGQHSDQHADDTAHRWSCAVCSAIDQREPAGHEVEDLLAFGAAFPIATVLSDGTINHDRDGSIAARAAAGARWQLAQRLRHDEQLRDHVALRYWSIEAWPPNPQVRARAHAEARGYLTALAVALEADGTVTRP